MQLREGDPAGELVAAAREDDAALIVVGLDAQHRALPARSSVASRTASSRTHRARCSSCATGPRPCRRLPRGGPGPQRRDARAAERRARSEGRWP